MTTFATSLRSLAFLSIFAGMNSAKAQTEAWVTARGAEVANVLGARLPQIAQNYGITENELRSLLNRETTIATDKDGNLLYACCAPTFTNRLSRGEAALSSTASGSATSSASSAAFPTEQTFLLHSRPSASKKIFLDFNGHTTTSTNWNTSYTSGAAISTPAFDFDGNAAAFSVAELTRIQLIWARVCEDFSAFDVDVTTEDPGVAALSRSNSADTTFGIRVCIGGTSTAWFKASAGGVAYVGSFMATTDTPCFVFATSLGNNEKYIADSTSHEIGHTLGLYHDGLVASATTAAVEYYAGHSNWAPIMGQGYGKAITQWSKGEYPNANNKQDDLAVMQTYGVSLRSDDHADLITAATTLSGTNPSVSGIISTRTDTDVFKFTTGAGSITFTAAIASPDSNLDAQLALYDGNGSLLTFANPTGLAATLTTTVAAGTYYIAIDGMGTGSLANGYTDYASLGQYLLTGTLIKSNNLAPIATAKALQATGVAPFAATLSSEGSRDSDGSIASYDWDFGDSSPRSNSTTPAHTYTTPGTYTASLVVTDNGGLSTTATVTITVLAPSTAMSIAKLETFARSSNGKGRALATVTLRDGAGSPVAKASITGSWSGSLAGSFKMTTDRNGVASFLSPTSSTSGSYTFTVTDAAATGRILVATATKTGTL